MVDRIDSTEKIKEKRIEAIKALPPKERKIALLANLGKVAWEGFSKPEGITTGEILNNFYNEVGVNNAQIVIINGRFQDWVYELRQFGSIKPLNPNSDRLVAAGPGENKYV